MVFEVLHVFGQENQKEIYIRFPVGNSILNPIYDDNASRLSELMTFLESVKKDSTLELIEVSFLGFASPEGGFTINKELAKKRRDALECYVRKHISLPDSVISRHEGTIAWERLAELVELSDMPYQDEAVDVLRNIPEYTYNDKDVLIDSRKKHLMELHYGRTWNYMHKHFFAQIRNANAIFVTARRQQEVKIEESLAIAVAPIETGPIIGQNDTIIPVVPVVSAKADIKQTKAIATVFPKVSRPFYMALKTNMLYDVLAIPNVGMEFYLGKNWSINGNWIYGWWNTDRNHRYWRIYGGDLAVRYWFGKKAHEKPLTGHHIGIYGQAFTYDFEWGGKGYMGGEPGGTLWDKTNYAVGMEYGYSLPVANRLNIDFTLGVGYWVGKYYEYIPLDGHYVWQTTKNRRWFGPTKGEISLVWLIGRGNSNDKKGVVR